MRLLNSQHSIFLHWLRATDLPLECDWRAKCSNSYLISIQHEERKLKQVADISTRFRRHPNASFRHALPHKLNASLCFVPLAFCRQWLFRLCKRWNLDVEGNLIKKLIYNTNLDSCVNLSTTEPGDKRRAGKCHVSKSNPLHSNFPELHHYGASY